MRRRLTAVRTAASGACLSIAILACASPGSLAQTPPVSPEIVLNDRTFEAELPHSIASVERRAQAVLVEMGFAMIADSRAVTRTDRRFNATDGSRVVHISVVGVGRGVSRIGVDAVALTQRRGVPLGYDTSFARMVLERIVREG